MPQVIVMRLHVRKSNVVIPTPERVGTVGSLSSSVGFSTRDKAVDVARAHYHSDINYLLP